MTIHTPPVNVPALDLSANTPETGDTVAFPSKMAGLIGQLEQENANVRGTNTQFINALAALSDAIEANTAALMSYDEKLIELANSQYNLFGDHGSFIDGCELATNQTNNNAFSVAKFAKLVTAYNGGDTAGMTLAARVPRYSSTYGGSESAVNSNGQAFVTAMGTNVPLYVNPFCVARFTTGSGTSIGGLISGTYAFFSFAALINLTLNRKYSISMWLKPEDNPVYIQGFDAASILQNYINGERVSHVGGEPAQPSMHKISVGEIAHVCMTYNPNNASSANYPRWYCAPSSNILIAAPVLNLGAQPIPPNPVTQTSNGYLLDSSYWGQG